MRVTAGVDVAPPNENKIPLSCQNDSYQCCSQVSQAHFHCRPCLQVPHSLSYSAKPTHVVTHCIMYSVHLVNPCTPPLPLLTPVSTVQPLPGSASTPLSIRAPAPALLPGLCIAPPLSSTLTLTSAEEALPQECSYMVPTYKRRHLQTHW